MAGIAGRSNLTVVHTPYDGTSMPFSIGLSALDLSEWIEIDDRLDTHLKEKDRLEALHPGMVFAEEANTRISQGEVLDALVSHLLNTRPDIYTVQNNTVSIAGTGRSILIDNPDEPPLKIAAKLVQEDLVLMRRGNNGWRLVAASLSFPSSWSLREKFGQVMHDIHKPVPGFGPGTRNAQLIDRMFDNLPPSNPVKRFNWSIYSDGDLYHPDAHGKVGLLPEQAFIRVERQTLRKMPVSGDILFTIRIHHDPLLALAAHPDAPRIARSMASQLNGLDAEQLAYKGLVEARDRLVNRLNLL